MVSIIYPNDDLIAHDVSMKLAFSVEEGVYVVPKYGEDEDIIRMRLMKSKYILLICSGNILLDDETYDRILFALNEKITIYAMTGGFADDRIINLAEKYPYKFRVIYYDFKDKYNLYYIIDSVDDMEILPFILIALGFIMLESG